MTQPITRNTLFYGDNLTILRDHIADASVDLIYLDPPFNSNRNYNVLFRSESGAESEAQVQAFGDTWHWNQAAADQYHALITGPHLAVGTMIAAFHAFIGPSQMLAYLVMMAARLVELHRVLKPTGSLYLHCDPTASHYLKVMLDTIFGAENFRNEIVWRRKGGSALKGMRSFSTATDFILYYTKTGSYTFNPVYMPLDQEYIEEHFTRVDENGRRFQPTVMRSPNPRPNLMYDYKGYKMPPNGWAVSRERMEQLDREGRLYFPEDKSKQIYRKIFLDEYPGQLANNLWTDIATLKGQAAELLGYPTQKPVALLERIVRASSNPGDVVLDPFCGCGTTIAAAQNLDRRWIGIDITHLSIALQKYRLNDSFKLVAGQDYDVVGEPVDLGSARQLAEDNRYQFQWWALSLIQARPLGGEPGSKQGKKGADQGIDGMITFVDELAKPKRVIVQVKSGKVSARDIRDLAGTMQASQAAIGVFITLEPPSAPMLTAAAAVGHYHSPGWNRDYPALQILTIEELLAGKRVLMPSTSTTFRVAEAVTKPGDSQLTLGLE